MNPQRKKDRQGSKFRAERPTPRGVSVIFGRRPVAELLQHAPERIYKLYVKERFSPSASLEAALNITEGRLPREVVSTEFLDELCCGNHQGIAAEVVVQNALPLEAIIRQSLAPEGNKLIIVLDEISDPGNLGAIMRTAEAGGADGLLFTERRSSPLSQVARRASAGASEFLPHAKVQNLHRSLEQLKEAGFWLVGTHCGAPAQNLFNIELPQPLALVFGSEGQGIRRLTQRTCDILVEIPLAGRIQSLNVSQAASVVIFECLRRRLQRNVS